MAGKQQKVEGILAELGVEELYDFLGASPQSTQKELTSCYRKKALKYHPDKNPDNPNAADLFQKLSKTYNILTDPAAKAAYDKWLKAKHAAALRNKELSTKRRKMKESLESRETRHQANIEAEVDALKQMQREVERLREEGYQLARQQEELLRQELLTKAEAGPRNTAAGEPEAAIPTLKVTWKCKKKDASSNGGYSQELLENIFSKFGALDNIVVSRKGGKALVVFRDSSDAATAKDRAQGLPDNPLVITWIGGGDSQAPPTITTSTSFTSTTLPCSVGDSATPPAPPTPSSSGAVSERDYESLTLMRMRQAEERKRLNQQLAAQDSDE